MKTTNPSKFLELPDELLHQIIRSISPEEVFLNVQLACKRLRAACSQPLLWKDHCQAEFKYWDPKHRIQQKLKGRVNDVDWRKLYVHRMRTDEEITRILDDILRAQVGRIGRFARIEQFGYDAKDTLLRHCRTGEEAEDVLARRYYAKSALDHLHRSQALAVWEEVMNGDVVPLDRALGSFDLFVLHDQVGDLSEISRILDDLAAQVRTQYPKFDDLTTRRKAIVLASFVLEHNLTGCESEETYRDLQNNFLGIALQDNDHPSLPLLSVGIYCCIATRLGIDARPCGVPHHVHAMVFPSATETLDGREVPTGDDAGEPMFLDPFRSDVEVSKHELHKMLGSWGIKPIDYSRFLSEVDSHHLMLRTARNILASVQEYKARNAANAISAIQLRNNPFTDMENAFYAALWSNFIFSGQTGQADTYNQRQFIPLILERYERLYPMDSDLVERYICPLFRNQGQQYQEYQDLQAALHVVRAADQTPKQVRRRGGEKPNHVNYYVGQVFRHRRYAYEGVVIGWETECGMNSQWIETNRVDALSRGRHQSFYHVLVEDNSLRYVAEENMEILEPEAPKSLLDLAGKYFKRWDGEGRRFVSNIGDEYPDN